MRYELVYFLQATYDEKVIRTFIKNMDAKSLMTLLHYLSLTDQDTKERWLTIYHKLFK
ncbi:hypothetical protein N0O92_07450 [Alkalihalobacillus sp. MEB130]|uniref:hypothetical protein n=1 Tax=Alkalihalobacillus sp. MEB130 TaxID=2976704 RepID=UPI0028DD54E4|nr:hypothetical protein [Alkalihalobacillus sp. MEB130]MDT8860066.1 hypothetical protein [Alkalihalobacillus sp. MEB130]